MLGAKPLIAWSIEVARDISRLCDILVSTDDERIAQIARAAGASVPWMRPAELATDAASSVDVALHALDWYEQDQGPVDGLLLLQPTSPFRTRESIEQALDLFVASRSRPVVSFSQAASHPMWCFRAVGDRMQPFIDPSGLNLRSQELEPAWVLNGALYVVSPNYLRQHRSFLGDDLVPLFTPEGQGLDIDTQQDWDLAISVLKYQFDANEPPECN